MSAAKKGDRVHVAFDAVYHDRVDGRHVVNIAANTPGCTVLIPLPDDAEVEILRPPVEVGDVIETAEELDALPLWSVVLTGDRVIAQYGVPGWYVAGSDELQAMTTLVPATVLYLPDGAA